MTAAEANEGDVEVQFVVPLLERLGYGRAEIASKVPVKITEGRKGRNIEADFVVYGRQPHGPDTSLIIVEAKATWEPVNAATRTQAESYAKHLLAPFCLLTNGRRVQLWQLQTTQSSKLLFDQDVADLEDHFGELSLILSRDAAVDYASRLDGKTLLEAAYDWSVYLGAEQARSNLFAPAISRTLRDAGGQTLSSDQLLAGAASGAVILAPSGLGKSTLAQSLYRTALEQRIAAGGPLPIEIPLTALAPNESLQAYAQARLRAHKPGLTQSGLQAMLRRDGLVFVCDGFDEISAPAQGAVESEAANLLKDYPRIQIILLSRSTSAPNAPLPGFELLPLTDVERRTLIDLLEPSPQQGWFNVPSTIWSLCANPLLLRLTVEYRAANAGAFPASLDALFRGWLDQALRSFPRNQLEAARLEAALSVLAEPASASLTVQAAEQRLVIAGFPTRALDDLHKRNLVEVSSGRVGFSHQALADHLRAKRIAALPTADALSSFQALELDADSLLPVLLMNALTSFDLQEALWERVAELSLPVYLSVLRYRPDLSAQLSDEDPEAVSLQILTGLQRGVEQPLRGFFPDVQGTVRRALLGVDAEEIRVVGRASASSVQLVYGMAAKPPGEPAVEIGSPTPEMGLNMHNLGMSGRSIDSGRLLAAQVLRKSLLKTIKLRDLPGGSAWKMERLSGRMRFLAVEHGLDYIGLTLDQIARALEPDRDKWAGHFGLGDRRIFSISELLDDLAALMAEGRTELDLWFPSDPRGEPPREALPALIDEHFRRSQHLYRELVDAGFSGMAQDLSFHSVLPVRWTIVLTQPRPQGWREWTMHSNWTPVKDWSETGADVTFEPATWRPDWRRDHERTLEALARLKRGKPGARITMSSSGLPDFSGHPFNGRFDGETSALREACDYLSEDLKDVFRDLPRDGWA